MLVSYWLFKAYSLYTDAKDGTVTCEINFPRLNKNELNSKHLQHQIKTVTLDKRETTVRKEIQESLTKISVHMYAPVVTGRSKALLPSGNERN